MNSLKWFIAIISKINLFGNKKKEIKPFITIVEMKEIDKKIEDIKNKYDEREMIIRNFEHQIKLVEAYNKQYDYKLKIMDIKGKILNDCLSIIKDVMNDIKTL